MNWEISAVVICSKQFASMYWGAVSSRWRLFWGFQGEWRTDGAERLPEVVDVPLNASGGLPGPHIFDIIGYYLGDWCFGGEGTVITTVKSGFDLP